MSLRIAENLELPEEAVTQTFAILAKRGVGKTYTASVLVEEIIKAGPPVVVVDPIGVWWGLRASADDDGPGLPIVIAGGDHADVPITPGSGEVVARLVVEQNLSLVIDLSLLRKHERTHFMTDFAETLYHLNRTARHLVLDEADGFAPQQPVSGEQQMLGAVQDIVRRGRAHGLGVTLISQRSAELSKGVLT
jgi:DNA helicase HerA-like ATPase